VIHVRVWLQTTRSKKLCKLLFPSSFSSYTILFLYACFLHPKYSICIAFTYVSQPKTPMVDYVLRRKVWNYIWGRQAKNWLTDQKVTMLENKSNTPTILWEYLFFWLFIRLIKRKSTEKRLGLICGYRIGHFTTIFVMKLILFCPLLSGTACGF